MPKKSNYPERIQAKVPKGTCAALASALRSNEDSAGLLRLFIANGLFVRKWAPEAFQEALRRYPADVEGALIFFGYACGLGIATPVKADIVWAKDAVASILRETA